MSESPNKKHKPDDYVNGKPNSITADLFTIPSDWPSSDTPIDLTTHDHAHASSDTEWWYINTHCYDANNENHRYSIFASFFRIIRSIDPLTHIKQYAHALCYCIVDHCSVLHTSVTVLDYDADIILKQQLEQNIYNIDYRFKQALLEILRKRTIPLPDIKMKQYASCTIYDTSNRYQEFKLDYDGNTLYKLPDDTYQLYCYQSDKNILININIRPIKPVIRQANDGVVKVGLRKDTMYYYFIPRCNVTGNISLNNKSINISGLAWYDHEFGGTFRADLMITSANNTYTNNHMDSSMTHKHHLNDLTNHTPVNGQHSIQSIPASYQPKQYNSNKRGYAWNWFSIQLDNEMDITVTQLIDIDSNNIQTVFQEYAITIDSHTNNYQRNEYHNISITHSKPFVSLRTTNMYPLQWTINIPDANIVLNCTAIVDDQEILTLISKPAFYEGVMHVHGTIDNYTVSGSAWIERQGFNELNTLENFFRNMGKETIRVIDSILPSKPSYEQARELIATSDHSNYMIGVNLDIYSKTITQPLRDIINRGGKSWRSLACLLCVDAVGGQSSTYRHWLAMPEIMHVGSLIIDDIQDQSTHRRGGDACHIMYGNALAINTGCAAYFLSLNILNKMTPDLSSDVRLKLYEYYFLGLRAGHTGQGFDLYGLDYMMSGVVQSGNNNELVDAILCTHRLKSAVPAGCLARMGAVIGNASIQHIELLGTYFESIGLAFQIIDDILNITGFAENKKDRCEDIKAGKITYPIAVAMNNNMLNTIEQRQLLWQSIHSKPTDDHVIDTIVSTLIECGAIDRSMQYATDLVNQGWAELDRQLNDSFYKMVLRAFGLYVLERKW